MLRPSERAIPWAGLLIALGVAVLSVSLAHTWIDFSDPATGVVLLAVENVVPLFFGVFLVGVGVVLRSLEWESAYVRTVTLWVLGASAVTLVLHGWLLGAREASNHTISPVVLAANTVVVGAALGLAAGVYNARLERSRAELATERDQFSALFENTTDCVVFVEYEGKTPVVLDANTAFEETFGYPLSAVCGESLAEYVVPDDTDGALGEFGEDAEPIIARAKRGESVESEVRRLTEDGVRDFLVRVIPLESYDHERAYVVYTDITQRKRLHQAIAERERVEYLHGVASELADVTSREALADRALDAADEALDFEAAVLVVDGETMATRNADDPLDRAAVARAVEEQDPVRETVRGDADLRPVVTIPVADRGALQLTLTTAALDERDVSVADLLATHLGATLARLDREDRVQTERERLEFLNRTLRHNLLNGLNVVQARTDILTDEVDGDLEDHVQVVRHRADEMADLVERMRTFTDALVDSESHELHPVKLREVLAAELADARERFPAAEFTLTGTVSDALVTADALLGTVVEHVLTNGVQHNDNDTPRVRVTTTETAESVEVRVTDNGPGVPDGEKGSVFEKGIEGLSQPGNGFGLYLVKEIVDVYGGDVGVEDAPDSGAAFWIRLPRAG